MHVVIHSGEKRHVCNECGKGFYRKDHLRKHTRSHIARRLKAELNQGQPGDGQTGENGNGQNGNVPQIQQNVSQNTGNMQQQGTGTNVQQQQQQLNSIQQTLIQQQIVQAQQLQVQLQQHGQMMSS